MARRRFEDPDRGQSIRPDRIGSLIARILQERILAYNLTVIDRDASWREEPWGEVAKLILSSVNHQWTFVDESHRLT